MAISEGSLPLYSPAVIHNFSKQSYISLYDDQLTDKPRKQFQKIQNGYDLKHGWVFLSKDCKSTKAVRTYKTLFAMAEEYTYYTPNTFYRNDKRNEGSLRWLNAIVVDVDTKNGFNEGMTQPDLMDLIQEAGLPLPSLIVKTPSGGFHIYWHLLKPMPGTPKAIKLYKDVQREIATLIQGDLAAVGPERFFRIPTNQNVSFWSGKKVSMNDLKDWLIIQRESNETINHVLVGYKGSLLSHPAIQNLLKGVEQGKRDNTCYTLALTFKAEGYGQEKTESLLREWNSLLDQPLTILDVKRKVRSAFKKDAPKGPSAHYIQYLSGMTFSYRPIVQAVKRTERKQSHLTEWESDVIHFIKKHGGSIQGAQRKLAEEIGQASEVNKAMSYSSFKLVMQSLVDQGKLIKKVEGTGRAAVTTYTLVVPHSQKVVEFKPKSKNQFNGPYSNTLIDPVVGGKIFSFPSSGSPSSGSDPDG